ncbi:MAG: PAS domain S-box protein [Candidatus Acidiferrales bacterium]
MSSDRTTPVTDKSGAKATDASGDAQFEKLVEVISRSQMNYRELIDHLDHAVFTISLDGEIRVANRRLAEILDTPFKDLIGHTLPEFLAAPTLAEVQDAIPEFLKQGSWSGRVTARLRKDGSARFYDCWLQLQKDEEQPSVTGWARDVTDRIDIERQLHQEQEFVRQLVASFPDMISVLDREGRVTFTSPRIKDVLGYASESLMGEEFGSAIHRDDLPEIKQMFRKLISGETASVLCEYRTLHQDGTWRILRASASPLFDSGRKISGVVASIRDVTEVKNTEKQLVQKEKLAAMGEMMSGVAHELNNPLTAIIGISDLLHDKVGDDSSKRQIGLVLKQARRAAAIVQNLLSFARPSALVSKKLRIEDVVRSVTTTQELLLKPKNIELQVEVESPLPAVQGDAKLLQQVLLNLISNAEQSIAAGSGRGRITVTMKPEGGKIVVKVLDDGAGIPAANLSKIFDPFFTTKRPSGGTGLGLTICAAIVKEHGGTIEVQSVAGSGAEFIILLPAFEELLPAPAMSAPVVRPAVSAPAGKALLQGHSVFVVDDEESIREIVQEGLSGRGMIVEGAASSEEALALLPKRTYDFVLCDYNLPGMNGDQFFDLIRSRNLAEKTKFVFMTGAMFEPSEMALFKDKGAFVLQKPFHIAALASMLVELLQASKSPAS